MERAAALRRKSVGLRGVTVALVLLLAPAVVRAATTPDAGSCPAGNATSSTCAAAAAAKPAAGEPAAADAADAADAAAAVPAAAAAARAAAAAAAAASDSSEDDDGEPAEAPAATGGGAPAEQPAAAAEEEGLAALAARLMPARPAADRGSYVDFLLFVSEAGQLPTHFKDKHFQPIVVAVPPPLRPAVQQQAQPERQQQRQREGEEAEQQQQQQRQQQGGLSAGELVALLAQHRAQFSVSLGDRAHFGFLEQLPAQARRAWFHLDSSAQLDARAVEAFYWAALAVPPAGAPGEPLLSVFTAAYKSGHRIQVPYDSLRSQTYTNWEWVVLDDSPPSHNDTWARLSALRDADPRVRVFRSDRNDGFIGSTKAAACGLASGALLVELDHDDRLLPSALGLLAEAAALNPGAGLLYSDAAEVYEGGSGRSVDYGSGWAFGQGAHYRALVDGHWVTAATAPALNGATLRHIVGVPNHVRAWSRAAYQALGGHARGLPVADDYDLVLRALLSYPAVYVRHLTYIQYRRDDEGTFTFKRNALIQRLVRLLGRGYDARISAALSRAGVPDGGFAAWKAGGLLQDQWEPVGPPLARPYHRAAAQSPPGRPRVSVIVSTFNRRDQLLRALRSVYAQDYDNWELIIVGDRCPVLDEFMERHKGLFERGGHEVRWYNLHDGGGPGGHAPRNYALKALATSDWVAYLDDDNEWAPHHLSSLVALVAADPGLSYAFASLAMNGKVLLCSEPKLYRLDTSAVLHHTRLVETYGAWRSQAAVGYANDWEFFSRWVAGGERWAASLSASVIYHGADDGYVQRLLAAYD